MAQPLGTARVTLAIRLHDSSNAQWTTAELNRFLNSGIRRTLVRSRSYLSTSSLAVVADTHTYDASSLHEIKVVRLGDVVLNDRQMGDMPMIHENWDALLSGQPKQWVPLGGTQFRIAPAPNAAYASMIGTVATAPTAGGTGYAVGEVLEIDEGTGGKVVVSTVSAGVVTAVALNSTTDTKGRTIYDRGSGYTVAASKATTPETGSGTGCTVEVTALAKLEAYGAAEVTDIAFDTPCTVALSTDLVTATAHGRSAGDPIEFSATTGGMVVDTTYYVIASGLTADAFKFSTSAGGSAFNITADGSNTFGPSAIASISDARMESYLKAAEEEAWAARPSMLGSAKAAHNAREAWLDECQQLRIDLGLENA